MTLVLRMLPVLVAGLTPLIVMALNKARVSGVVLELSVGALVGLILLTLAIAIKTQTATGS